MDKGLNFKTIESQNKYVAVYEKSLELISVPITKKYVTMFGENEFAFSVTKAMKRAETVISNVELEIVPGASHLLPVSNSSYVNQRVSDFIVK